MSIIEHLTRWQSDMVECEQQIQSLIELTDAAPDSPLISAIYAVMGSYTLATAKLIDWDEDTIEAWWIGHRFGEVPMNIGFPGEAMRTISSIEAFAEFIAEDQRRAAA